jgi:hypothetical protein
MRRSVRSVLWSVQGGDATGRWLRFDPGRDAPHDTGHVDAGARVESRQAGLDAGLVVEAIDAFVSVPGDGVRVMR